MTPLQKIILARLGKGMRYEEIRQELQMSLSALHAHCSRLRKATGIVDLKNPKQCRAYLRDKGMPQKKKPVETGPTPAQLRVMALFADGRSIKAIAELSNNAVSTISNTLCQGCIRAGVHRRKLRPYLERIGAVAPTNMGMNDPMF